MGFLHGRYAQVLNARYGRTGHVFEGRYGSVPVRDDPHLWVAARYIARNPVEAGIVATADRWPWSSHAAVLAGTGPAWLDAARLLEHFSGVGGDPRERDAELVAVA
jgi:putative transposase